MWGVKKRGMAEHLRISYEKKKKQTQKQTSKMLTAEWPIWIFLKRTKKGIAKIVTWND